jgi:hypothetical protein
MVEDNREGTDNGNIDDQRETGGQRDDQSGGQPGGQQGGPPGGDRGGQPGNRQNGPAGGQQDNRAGGQSQPQQSGYSGQQGGGQQGQPQQGRPQTGQGPGAQSQTGGTGEEQADPIVSGVASFFVPGLGHALINEQVKRGVIVFAVASVLDFVIVVVSTLLTVILIGFFGYLLLPVVHLVAAYDAYNQAEKINAGEVIPEGL